MPFKLTPKLVSSGFTSLDSHTITPRMCVGASGPDKTGKTTFGGTMPGKIIAAFSNDTGTRDVLKRAAADRGKEVLFSQFADAEQMREWEKNPPFAKKEWNRAKDAAREIVATREIRSGVIDTGGGFWELCRLAELGKLTKVMPHQYAAANNNMDEFFSIFYDRPDFNLLIIHKVKKLYKNNEWDGKSMTDAAYENMRSLVDMRIEHTREMINGTVVFGVRVLTARHNAAEVLGKHFTTRMADADGVYDACSMVDLALATWPDTDEGMWL